MKKVAGILFALGVTICGFAGVASANDNSNSEEYWEDVFAEYNADCFKHGPYDVTPHGSVTNEGHAVTLNPFGKDWEQEFYVGLIVKGGSVGDGNAQYIFPVAGTPYFAPINNGGQQSAVSHWIVCKGYTPVDTTTTTLQETTSSVTIPVDSSSTVPADTSTSVTETTTPAGSTETTQGNPGTTEVVTLDLTSTNQGLPETGQEDTIKLIAAGLMIVAGTVLLLIRKRAYA